MKVTLFNDLKEEKWLSMQLYGRALADNLAKLGADDLQMTNYQPKATHFLSRFQPLFHQIPYFRFYGNDLLFSRLFKYPLEARFQQGDVNHILDHSYAHLLRVLDPKKTVVTVHDLIPIVFDTTPSGEEKSKYLRLFEATVRNLKKAAFLIVDSQNTKKDLVKLLGGSAAKIRVIYLGVDPIFRPLPPKEVGGRGFTIMHLGHNEPYKNIEGILQALAILRDVFKLNFTFIKLGKDFEPHQKEEIKRLKLDSCIVYLGYRNLRELPYFYNAADLLLLPSLYEGFGFPILEALACGTPVVSSLVGSLPEVGGEAVYWVDPNDPESIAQGAHRLLTDKGLRDNLRQKGFVQVRKFSWKKTARQTLQVYREVYNAYSSP